MECQFCAEGAKQYSITVVTHVLTLAWAEDSYKMLTFFLKNVNILEFHGHMESPWEMHP